VFILRPVHHLFSLRRVHRSHTLRSVSSIEELIERERDFLVRCRHDLHRHPELSRRERRTSEVVQRVLREVGIACRGGYAGGTGVLGYLPATGPVRDPRPTIALRADMDALPIDEQSDKPWVSETPGVMHACGHDGHTTILLGTARVLSQLPRPRPVLFIFQPAEEDGGGGEHMCRDGVLEGEAGGGLGEPVGQIFGLHGWPTLEVGTVGSRPGPLLASTDDFEVTIHGRQSHGAFPHEGRDPIVAAAACILGIQSIASRAVSPLDSVVVTVGVVNAGQAGNIIPATARFVGTARALTDATRALARERFFEVVEGTARAHGCRAEIRWDEGYPVTHNDPALTERFFATARAVIGPERVRTIDNPTMGGEDFAYYGRRVPACFFFLGLRPPGESDYPRLHQPRFDFNDDALPVGVRMMCELALR
jgi:amidohydrolase